MPQNRYKIVFFPKHLKLPQGPPGVPQWTPPQKYLQHNSTWQLLKFSPSSFLRKGSCLVSALPGRFGTLIWTVRVTWTDWRSGESVGRCVKLFWIVFDVFVFDVFEACASNNFESCLMFSPHLSTIWTQSSASAQRLLATVEKKIWVSARCPISFTSTLKTGMLVFMVIRKSVNLVRPSPWVTASSTLISR